MACLTTWAPFSLRSGFAHVDNGCSCQGCKATNHTRTLLPPEPTPAHTGTLRNIPEPSSGTCSCDPHRHTPGLIWAEDPISLRCWGKNRTLSISGMSWSRQPRVFYSGQVIGLNLRLSIRPGLENASSAHPAGSATCSYSNLDASTLVDSKSCLIWFQRQVSSDDNMLCNMAARSAQHSNSHNFLATNMVHHSGPLSVANNSIWGAHLTSKWSTASDIFR